MTGLEPVTGVTRAGVVSGTELNQTYRIDSLIGVGGMGEVFRGHNIQTGDPVAIKIVLPEFARDDMILELFRKEARILNHLSHDAIVRYYVFSMDPVLGRPYLAMEFMDGASLAERIKSGPLAFDEVVFLQRRLADGLQKAHEAGVIHRDMSPDNVILPGGRMDRAKIIDFGIAKSANVGGGTLIGGSFAGKYNFVSPEQLGLYGGEVTPRSDVYSLGLVLAAALKGQALDMSGSQVEVIEKRRVVPDLAGIDPRMRGLLAAMLQPDPAARLASMAAVRDWTPEAPRRPPAGAATVVQPKRQSPPVAIPRHARPAKPARSRRLGGLLFALLAVAAIGAGAFGGWYYVQTQGLYPSDKTEKVAQTTVPPVPAKPEVKEQTAAVEKPTEPPSPEKMPVPPAPPEVLDKAAQMVAFVETYNGGDCFYATPQTVTATNSAITGFGKSQEPFERFMAAFKDKTGVEPDIRLGIVSDQQCATVSALRKLTAASAGRPTLSLNKDVLVSGTPLEGSVSRLEGRELELLIVDSDGNVQNLRKFVTAAGDDIAFRIKVQHQGESGAGGYLPMLILAIATREPLAALANLDAAPAAELLPKLVAEISLRGDAATAAGYFKLVAPGG